MTVLTTANRVVNLGNGATTSFSYNFLIPDATDAVVIYTNATGASTTLSTNSYTITGVGVGSGGTVIYPLTGPAIATGTSLTIERLLPLVQGDSIANQTFYPNVIESALDYEMMCLQQVQDEYGRGITGPVTDPPGINYTLPSAAQRANSGLAFDANGNVIAGSLPSSSVSSAMMDVFQAASHAAALSALGITSVATSGNPLPPANGGTGLTTYGPLTGANVSKTTNYSVTNTDKGETLYLSGGSCFTLTMGTPSGFDPDFQIRVINQDPARGKFLNLSGITQFLLWPLQSMTVQNLGGATWGLSPPPQRWYPQSSVTIYVDPTGSDTLNDGLTTGASGAYLTISKAISTVYQNFDLGGYGATIQCADGTYAVGAGVPINYPEPAQISLLGDTASTTNCIITCSSAGACFNPTSPGSVITVSGFYFQTSGTGSTAINASGGVSVILCTNTFGAFTNGRHVVAARGANVSFSNSYTVLGGMVNHIQATLGSVISYGSLTVSVPNPLTCTAWASTSDVGVVSMGGSPLTFTGSGSSTGTTGSQYTAIRNSVIDSSVTVFPGSTTGTTNTGGIYS